MFWQAERFFQHNLSSVIHTVKIIHSQLVFFADKPSPEMSSAPTYARVSPISSSVRVSTGEISVEDEDPFLPLSLCPSVAQN